ncbi:MAG: hypothetical protein H0W81_11975 [Chloroflexi bacterium]|nr:hypothetical protein [Chloroflexota bacterium]
MSGSTDFTETVRGLEARVARLEGRLQARRQDYRDGNGVLRVRVGQQDGGAWGVRVWSNAGALVIDDTTPA